MPNPSNPLDWIKSAQDWFRRTERSSGFRPYLIFLLIHVGFVIVLLSAFPESEVTKQFAVNSLYLTVGGFVILFAAKAFQDPNFCRSEKHIENVRRLELMEQKGDDAPRVIDVTGADVKVIDNPHAPQLTAGKSGGAQ